MIFYDCRTKLYHKAESILALFGLVVHVKHKAGQQHMHDCLPSMIYGTMDATYFKGSKIVAENAQNLH